MLYQDRRSKIFTLFVVEVISLLVIGWVLNYQLPANGFPFGVKLLKRTGIVMYFLATIQVIAYLMYWCIYHKIHKGFRYAFRHWKMVRNIRRQLLEAGNRVSNLEYTNEEVTVVLPKVKVWLSDDLSYGRVTIRNSIKWHKVFEDIEISSALGDYVVFEQYQSDNLNDYIFEIETSGIKQLVFNDYQEFVEHCKDYMLFMDGKNSVPLHHSLLVGATGSGKTYAIYSLVFQLLNFTVQPEIYFADPKNSSLYVLGNHIAPTRTAGTTEEITALLEAFYLAMTARQEELKEHLNDKLDSTFKDWGLQAHVLIIDEFSSFQAVVNTMDKQTRDKVAMYLTNIVQKGRQLGFFLWIAMQKSDSKVLPTAIRDNLVFKVVLGQATNTTLETAFEEYADLPKFKFGLGQGLYSYQGLTKQPKVCSFPTLDFDILEAVKQL